MSLISREHLIGAMGRVLRSPRLGPVAYPIVEVAARLAQRRAPRVHGVILVVCDGDAEITALVTSVLEMLRHLVPARYDRMARELSCLVVQESPLGDPGQYLPRARLALLAPSVIRETGVARLAYLILRLAVEARLANAGFRPNGRDAERAKRIWVAECEYVQARYAALTGRPRAPASSRPAG